jgi:ribonuclease HI
MKRPAVSIYTDGSCLGNPGPGGYAAVLISGNKQKSIGGSHPHSTNNLMELWAIWAGIHELMVPCDVTVVTDSLLSIKWLTGVNKRKDPSISQMCENIEAEILTGGHKVTFEKVGAHTGNPGNEFANRLAVLLANKQDA